MKSGREGFFYDMFRCCKTKQVRWKNVFPATISHTQQYSIPEIKETLRVPLRKFSTLLDKNVSAEYSEIPFLSPPSYL